MDFTNPPDEPFGVLAEWLAAAEKTEPDVPHAMALASVDAAGLPNVRMVLLKELDENGLAFYTNLESVKAKELQACSQVAACFHWKHLRRQLRLRGPVQALAARVADAYFASRSYRSQLVAIASPQSQLLSDPQALARQVDALHEKYQGKTPPRPSHWGGWRIMPIAIEFWQEGADRLHERIIYERPAGAPDWTNKRLAP